MLNRRHIRIKILQLLYSKKTAKIDNKSLLKQFELTSQNFFKLFLTQILLLKEIYIESLRVIELNEKKYFKKDYKSIKKLFSENKLLKSIYSDKYLEKSKKKYELNYFNNNQNKVKNIFRDVLESESFINFNKKECFFMEDIYQNVIANSEELFDFYEECEIGWTDDFPLVNTILLNWIVSKSLDKSIKIPKKIFKDNLDKKFGKDLFRLVVKDSENSEEIIDIYTPDWDNDRIASVDKILIKMCIYEFLSFPSIPVKVSINEYVEISKDYSSPKSSTFINGVLNSIFEKLSKDRLIKKNERGSQ
tara:strand:+ start:9766 stop:10680 length:915 start_codon:yes stop_codon:yes gene_type:complete